MLSYLIANQDVTFLDEDLESAVLNYMRVTRESAQFDADFQSENNWNSFIEFLEYQDFQRERLIDETCAENYLVDNDGVYDIGGLCYVAN